MIKNALWVGFCYWLSPTIGIFFVPNVIFIFISLQERREGLEAFQTSLEEEQEKDKEEKKEDDVDDY